MLKSEAASNVIPGMFAWLAVPNKRVKFRDPCSNHTGEIRPKAVGCGIFGCTLNLDKCQTGVANDVISGSFRRPIVPNKHVKFGGPHTKSSQEISPENEDERTTTTS